jgi:iron complex transport system substrate-binding protein
MTASPRIVSLIASSTEILCALGFESHLVGRSHECDWPETVRRLPSCTEPKFDIRLPSLAIDERVRDLVQDALSVYRVDADKLRELRPDLVVTQTQCEVCAVSQRDVECALADWVDSRPRIVSLAAEDLGGVWADMRRVAAALAVVERGESLVAALRERMDAVARRAAACHRRPRVACIEWIEPLMAAGNWMPELVALAGGTNLLGEAGKHSPKLAWSDVMRAEPDVVVVVPCGFDLERTAAEMAAVRDRPEWRSLAARCTGQIFLADGNQFFNRPGPRLVESLEILAEILHPECFDFGHRGRGWRNWEAAAPPAADAGAAYTPPERARDTSQGD